MEGVLSPEGSTISGSEKLQELEKACHCGVCVPLKSSPAPTFSPPHRGFLATVMLLGALLHHISPAVMDGGL